VNQSTFNSGEVQDNNCYYFN